MTLTETLQRIQTSIDFEQLKMPLGFIRVLEFVFFFILNYHNFY